MTRSPALFAVSLAMLGGLLWWCLERWATQLGAASPQPGFDGVFVMLLLAQLCYFLIAVPRIRRAGDTCLGELDSLLDASNPEVIAIITSIKNKRMSKLILAFVVGGVITLVLQEAQFQRFSLWLDSPDFALGEFWAVVVAWCTWTLGLSSVHFLITHAVAIKRLGQYWIVVDLMRLERLGAFSRYGLQLAGLVIGLIAIWAVSIVIVTSLQGNDWNRTSNYIGLLMALIYVCLSVAVFIYPQLGVRQRIRQEKVRVYLGLTGMLPNSTQAIVQSASNPERLSALLSSRAQVQALPEWPTGAGQHARLRLSAFMVIPLLSWVAAALVERLISWLLV